MNTLMGNSYVFHAPVVASDYRQHSDNRGNDLGCIPMWYIRTDSNCCNLCLATEKD